MRFVNRFKWLGLLCLVCVALGAATQVGYAQTVEEARTFAAAKQYDKAIEVYDKLYLKDAQGLYSEYISTLLDAKRYKDAEKLVRGRLDFDNPYALATIDLGRVLKLQGNEKKAREQFDAAIKLINGDDMLTQKMAKLFSDAQEYDYAVAAFRVASAKLGNPYMYKPSIAQVQYRAGRTDSALAAITEAMPYVVTADQVKAFYLEWIGNDADKLKSARKMLIAKINEQPDNTNFVELLTWIYIQKNDWEGALVQIQAIDEANKEAGMRLLNLGDEACVAHQYDIAIQAYDAVVAKGAAQPLFRAAICKKLSARLTKLKEAPVLDSVAARQLMGEYNSTFATYNDLYGSRLSADYAYLAAQILDSLAKGIAILETAIAAPNMQRELLGELKLQLGDYQLIKGKVWDASLTYSQVDKQFRQDYLGEAARYRNAKLSYYRGDFTWAQNMLNVLKASTTELIANDALNLSVLITENVKDSNVYPLKRYAYAELLEFRNKDKEAATLLDSIAKAYPEHPLNDDILMAHANLAIKHQDYNGAIATLKQIVEKFGQDVLGDDALYKIAELYYHRLANKEQAQKYYEQLIIDFPASTFVQISRQRLKEITNPVTP